MSAALALGLLLGRALAGTVVTWDEAPDAAQRAAAEDPAFADATVVPWASVAAGPARVVEGGTSRACAQAPLDNVAIRSRLQDMEAKVAYGEWSDAADLARTIEASLPCLTEPAETADIQRLFTAWGVAAFQLGDRPSAGAAFAAARSAGADQAPANLPAAERALWDGLAAPVANVRLRVVAPTATQVRVDGHTLDGAVCPGPHLIQAGPGHAAWIDVAPGSRATLVFPAAFSSDAPLRLDEEALRADVSALLAATFGEGAAVALVLPDRVWLGAAGRTDWKSVVAEAPRTRRRSGPISGSLLVAGGAVGLVGGAVTGVSWLNANARRTDYRHSPTADDAVQAREAFYANVERFAVARWVGAAGGIVAVTGLTLHLAGPVAARPLPSGLLVEGRW